MCAAEASATSFHLSTSGAWIELTEPPGSSCEHFAVQASGERSESADLSPGPLFHTRSACSVEEELSAALSARSFLNSIVIGSILRQQQRQQRKDEEAKNKETEKKDTAGKGSMMRKSVARAKTVGPLTLNALRLQADDDDPEDQLAELKDCLTGAVGGARTSSSLSPRVAGRSGLRRASSFNSRLAGTLDSAVRSRTASFCVTSGAGSLSSPRSRLGAVASVPASAAGSAAPSPSASRCNSRCASPSASPGEVRAERLEKLGLRNLKKQKSRRSNESGVDGEAQGDLEAEADVQDPSADSMAMAHAAAWAAQEQTQQWMQAPMMTSSPYCLTLDGWDLGGHALGGLCLQAEVPYAAAALLGFAPYQPYGGAGYDVGQDYPANIGGAFGVSGQEVYPYSVPDTYGYQPTPDFAAPAAMDDAQGLGAAIEEDALEFEGPRTSADKFLPTRSGGRPLSAAPTSGMPADNSLPEFPSAPEKPPASPKVPSRVRGAAASTRSSVRSSVRTSQGSSASSPAGSPVHLTGSQAKAAAASGGPKLRPKAETTKPGAGAAPATARSKKGAEAGQRVSGGGGDDSPATIDEDAPSSKLPAVHRRRPPATGPATPRQDDVFIYTLSPSSVRSTPSSAPADASTADVPDATILMPNDLNLSPHMSSHEARCRSDRLLSKLSARGSPRKAAMLTPLKPGSRGLVTCDSKETVRTIHTASTMSGTTSAGLSSPRTPGRPRGIEDVKQIQLRRLRERRWDTSCLQKAEIPDISGVPDAELASPLGGLQKERAVTAPASKMSWGHSQELAASWAISLVTGPLRPATVFPSMTGFGNIANTESSGSLYPSAYKQLGQDYAEWHGSPLHEQFLRSLDGCRGQVPEGDAGAACDLAIEELLDNTHVELRTTLQERADASPAQQHSYNNAAWVEHCLILTAVLIDELQLPNARVALSSPESRSAQAVAQHSLELLAFRDATVRIIGLLVERECLLQSCGSSDELASRTNDDPVVARLAQMSRSLNMGISSWCRCFGHLAQLTCGQLALERGHPGSHGSPGQRPSLFLWCGVDALETLQPMKHQVSANSQSETSWPAAMSGGVGQAPLLLPDSPSRIPGYRTEVRAARSGTRALRALLRGGNGAAGQYVSGRYNAAESRDHYDMGHAY